MSKERPILFSTPMVRAILDGTKTQTRRMIKPQPVQQIMGGGSFKAMKAVGVSDDPLGWTWKGTRFMPWPKFLSDHLSPYGVPGDILWVRESWNMYIGGSTSHRLVPIYKASEDAAGLKWRPSIHMRKEYARIWLEVVSVKVERLNEISWYDAVAEGCPGYMPTQDEPTDQYKRLWESINGENSWAQNPWVWVVSFKVLSTTGKQ